ncbi:Calmodulin-regulated spectrin-associated protein 2, partial [Xenoophorus captivus]
GAHLAMIDTLMMAYTVETVSVEKVMAFIHQYSSCDSVEERPYDTEDALTTWINKVNEFLKDAVAQEQKKETQSAEQTGSPRVGVSLLLFSCSCNISHTTYTVNSVMDRFN